MPAFREFKTPASTSQLIQNYLKLRRPFWRNIAFGLG